MAQKKKKPAVRGKRAPEGRKAKPASGFETVKCGDCDALCCRYIAVEIDGPIDDESVDHMRWFLYHDKVSIYIQDGLWHLCVDVPCRNLIEGRKCRIHFDKPGICMAHRPEECEFRNPDFELDAEFKNWDQLRTYLKERGLPHR